LFSNIEGTTDVEGTRE